MTTLQMSNQEAWLYAASWGSYMRAGDPGACMYGFDERFRVQSEEHRADCLRHIEECRKMVEANPEDYAEGELDEMDNFIEVLKQAAVDTAGGE